MMATRYKAKQVGSSTSGGRDFRAKPKGWRGESHRHYLAAKGVKTCRPVMRPKDIDHIPANTKPYVIERKWDGTRMRATIKNGKLTLTNRRCADKTKTFPEMQELTTEISKDAVLDGEITVQHKQQKESFKLLAERDHLKDPAKISAAESVQPATFHVFDITQYDGVDVSKRPLSERKALIRKLLDTKGRVVRETPTTVQSAKQTGAEGVVLKEKDSQYIYGKSDHWLKHKFKKEADVAVLGATQGSGKRKGTVGALKIGVYDKKRKEFKSVGKVGTGFTDADLPQLQRRVSSGKPFVIRVQYLKKGSQGNLREPVYIAQRNDISARQTHV